jgi:hypothetical protein
VPALRRHEISAATDGEMDTAKGAHVNRKGGRANIKFRPELEQLQKRLKSKHALQFVVEYDVERPDRAGEIQVLYIL